MQMPYHYGPTTDTINIYIYTQYMECKTQIPVSCSITTVHITIYLQYMATH